MKNKYNRLWPGEPDRYARLRRIESLDPRVVRACGFRVLPLRWGADAFMRRLGRRDPIADGAPDPLTKIVRTVYPEGARRVGTPGTHL